MRRFRFRARPSTPAGMALATVLIGSAFVVGLGGPATATIDAAAAAQPAYKYWGYYHAAGNDWEFSTTGAHEFIPEDGAVEGWRYGLDTGGDRTPRALPDFDSICGDETVSGKRKLVAVVIDYGIPQEAEGDDETPAARGACANVPDGASGQQVLQSVADTTVGDAGIASVDGYPSVPTTETFDGADIPANEPPVELELATETDPAADDATDTEDAAAGDEDDGLPWGLIGVGAVAVVIAGGAIVVARRRS